MVDGQSADMLKLPPESYTDKNKNEQLYAASTAAAYAKKVLSVISPQAVDKLSPIGSK